MNEHQVQVKALIRYKRMFETAQNALNTHTASYPMKPLNDPEWQIWIKEYLRLNKNYGNAYIAWARQAVLVRLNAGNEGQA